MILWPWLRLSASSFRKQGGGEYSRSLPPEQTHCLRHGTTSHSSASDQRCSLQAEHKDIVTVLMQRYSGNINFAATFVPDFLLRKAYMGPVGVTGPKFGNITRGLPICQKCVISPSPLTMFFCWKVHWKHFVAKRPSLRPLYRNCPALLIWRKIA